MKSLRCLFGFHEWTAEMYGWYKNINKDAALKTVYREGKALSKIKNPDFVVPVPKCARCDYVPFRILDALMKAVMK